MQQYPFPRPVSSESMFSFWLSGLCLVTWHATCFAIINLAPPIASLLHGKMAGSGERCLIKHSLSPCTARHPHVMYAAVVSELFVRLRYVQLSSVRTTPLHSFNNFNNFPKLSTSLSLVSRHWQNPQFFINMSQQALAKSTVPDQHISRQKKNPNPSTTLYTNVYQTSSKVIQKYSQFSMRDLQQQCEAVCRQMFLNIRNICVCVCVFRDFESSRCCVQFNSWLCFNVRDRTTTFISHWDE